MEKEANDKEKEQSGEKVEKKKIELDIDQYGALLDRIAELEALAAAPKHREEVTDLETLAEEGRRQSQRVSREREETLPENLDEMTNTQLVNYIVDLVNRQGGERLQRLEVAVETLRVMREIDKAEREHDDFWKYESKIRELAINNPSLSIEDAYLLAKSKTPAKKEKEGEEEERPTTRTEKLLKLPPRTHGEKPGVAAGATEESKQVKTLRDAAIKAWNEVVGEGKTII